MAGKGRNGAWFVNNRAGEGNNGAGEGRTRAR